ncbi:MAG: hypothetical protein ABI627_16365 [Polyangiaceae bacterium]
MTELEEAISAQADARSDVEERERPPEGALVVRECDPVELALATALERASAAGAWALVEILGRELAARRVASAGVIQLHARRREP